ncbi:hypothetical protein HHI36_013984 [Cryptolaemus montrouzieri]|uniref:Sulfotransferase domain-containing protein n=1 Tax=Cryptolaemus montrouzieri TaxID=559131 RepID=A0ABD2N142_9CUCU
MENTCEIQKEENLPEIVDVEVNLDNELKYYFRGQKDGFVQVGPKKWLYPMKYKKLAQKYIDFEVRPDDVWISGIPRSGTTVTQELAWLLKNNLDFEGAKKDISYRVPFFEMSMVFNDKASRIRLLSHPKDGDILKKTDMCLPYLNSLKENRLIKTHLPLELLPPDLLEKGCKVIYVCRHPKDVAVSYFFLQKNSWNVDFQGDFAKYWNYFRNGNCMFGPYFEHVKQAFEKKELKNVLFVFYEDLRKDLTAFIKKVAEFLERPITESEVNSLKEHLDFNNFQKNSALEKLNEGSKNKFVRKGKVGGWRDHFTEEMAKEADEWIEENTKKIGFEYPS